MSKKKKTLDELLEEALVSEDEQPYEIPENWAWVRLGEVVSINPTKPKLTYDDDIVCSFLPMTMVNERSGSIIRLEERPFSKVKKGYTYFEKDDILFAKITPCMENGNTVIAEGLLNGFGFGSTEFYVIRPSKAVSNKYMYYLLRSPKFRSQAKQVMTGAVGQQRVPKSFLEDYTFALPPIEQQKAIVNKIEILFAKLDQAKQLIEEVKETFEFRRAAILSEIFMSEPTREEVSLGDLCEIFSGKGFKKAEYSSNGVRLLKIQNVSYRTTDWSDITFLPYEYVDKEPNLVLKENDLVMALNRPITRNKLKVTLIAENDLPIILYQRVGCIRSKVSVNMKYIYYFMTSSIFLSEVQSRLGGSDQPYINIPPLKSIKIPIVNLETQQKIVDKIETTLNVHNDAEIMIGRASNIDSIKQVILSKAFKGELGTNDSTDEPAIELLKSILKEKL